MRMIFLFLSLFFSANAFASSWGLSSGGKAPIAQFQQVLSTTAISTTAYTQLVAATSAAFTEVQCYNSSAVVIQLAVGASGSEVVVAYVAPASSLIQDFPLGGAASNRLAVKALVSSASTGLFVCNVWK